MDVRLLGSESAAVGLALLLGYAAVAKIDGWQAWTAAVRGWAPRWMPAPHLAVAIPAAESAVAIVALVRPRLGLAGGGLLLVVFGVGVLILGRRHQGKPCGCFGVGSGGSISWRLGVRNLVLGGAGLATAATAPGGRGIAVPAFLTGALALAAAGVVKQALALGDIAFRVRREGSEPEL
jgi:hypothetical protein